MRGSLGFLSTDLIGDFDAIGDFLVKGDFERMGDLEAKVLDLIGDLFKSFLRGDLDRSGDFDTLAGDLSLSLIFLIGDLDSFRLFFKLVPKFDRYYELEETVLFESKFSRFALMGDLAVE